MTNREVRRRVSVEVANMVEQHKKNLEEQQIIVFASARKKFLEAFEQQLAQSSRSASRKKIGSDSFLEGAELLLPRRLREEMIGDAQETIDRLISTGASKWKIWSKLGSTVFWLLVATTREVTSALLGKFAK